MSLDIKIKTSDYKFKFRVSGILIINNKLLTVKMNNNNFWCLPGGHVELMENTKDAIIREFFEETRIETKIGRLLYITENFFENCHEIGYYYILKPKNTIDTVDFNLIEKDKNGNINMQFKWIDINKLSHFKPEFIVKEINNISNGIKHYIIKDDKIIK